MEVGVSLLVRRNHLRGWPHCVGNPPLLSDATALARSMRGMWIRPPWLARALPRMWGGSLHPALGSGPSTKGPSHLNRPANRNVRPPPFVSGWTAQRWGCIRSQPRGCIRKGKRFRPPLSQDQENWQLACGGLDPYVQACLSIRFGDVRRRNAKPQRGSGAARQKGVSCGETTRETSARRPGGCLAESAVRQIDKTCRAKDLAA